MESNILKSYNQGKNSLVRKLTKYYAKGPRLLWILSRCRSLHFKHEEI